MDHDPNDEDGRTLRLMQQEMASDLRKLADRVLEGRCEIVAFMEIGDVGCLRQIFTGPVPTRELFAAGGVLLAMSQKLLAEATAEGVSLPVQSLLKEGLQ